MVRSHHRGASQVQDYFCVRKTFPRCERLLAQVAGKDRPEGLYVLDFEKAPRAAILQVFRPTEDPQACLFHFVQALLRRLREEGLYSEWATSTLFRRWYNLLTCLPFLHPNDVKKAYVELARNQALKDRSWTRAEQDKHLLFQKYFETTYLGFDSEGKATPRAVQFPVQQWSVYTRWDTSQTTSNYAESFHSVFGQHLLRTVKPKLNVFLDGLLKALTSTRFAALQSEAGRHKVPGPKTLRRRMGSQTSCRRTSLATTGGLPCGGLAFKQEVPEESCATGVRAGLCARAFSRLCRNLNGRSKWGARDKKLLALLRGLPAVPHLMTDSTSSRQRSKRSPQTAHAPDRQQTFPTAHPPDRERTLPARDFDGDFQCTVYRAFIRV